MGENNRWVTYYEGQKSLCPAPRGEGRTCRRVLLKVGRGEMHRVRWVGDRKDAVPPNVSGSTIHCDCGAIIEVKVVAYSPNVA